MNTKHYINQAKAVLLAAALLLLPAVQPVTAQESEVATLRAQVQELQRMVIDLQQQVQELQARVPSRPAVAASTRTETPVTNDNTHQIRGYARPDLVSSTSPGTSAASPALSPETIRENWHTLEKGMSNQKVNSLLGAPTRSFKLNNKLVWYYDYQGVGRGSVMFSEQGQVTDWQTPPTSHWFW